jgi:flagellin FlaB
MITIGVRARAGSGELDISQTLIELANNDTKVILTYDSANHAYEPAGDGGVFNTSAFTLAADNFGLIIIEDEDGSVNNTAIPIINRGDLVMLTIDVDTTFAPGLGERIDMWGNVIPEVGSWGILSFRTPMTYVDEVYDLQ